MKALIQRVERGSVAVDDKTIASIGNGYVILLGVRKGDTEEDATHLATRTVNLRIFSDAAGKMNRSIEDTQGEILAVSQFTLYANTRKGNRPGFDPAAPPDKAQHLYEIYVASLRNALGPSRVKTGIFGAVMRVEIINDGPVTIELTSDR